MVEKRAHSARFYGRRVEMAKEESWRRRGNFKEESQKGLAGKVVGMVRGGKVNSSLLEPDHKLYQPH